MSGRGAHIAKQAVLASAGVTQLDIDTHLTLNSSCEKGCSPAALYLHTRASQHEVATGAHTLQGHQ